MKVKKIHFIDVVPGQPIYEMEDGKIRIPYPDGKTGAMLWISEAEALKSLTSPTPENKNIIITQFRDARLLIRHKFLGSIKTNDSDKPN